MITDSNGLFSYLNSNKRGNKISDSIKLGNDEVIGTEKMVNIFADSQYMT